MKYLVWLYFKYSHKYIKYGYIYGYSHTCVLSMAISTLSMAIFHISYSMAIRNMELMHERSPQHYAQQELNVHGDSNNEMTQRDRRQVKKREYGKKKWERNKYVSKA